MRRIALTDEQRKEYKLLDFKLWVESQMKRNHMTQKDIADALGLSQSRISQMLKIPDKKKKDEKIEPDPFSLGQIITLFEFFDTDGEERTRLLTL